MLQYNINEASLKLYFCWVTWVKTGALAPIPADPSSHATLHQLQLHKYIHMHPGTPITHKVL